MKRKKGVAGVLLTIVSTLVAVLFLFPVIWALAVSFKKEGTAVSNAIQWFLPPYTAQNYPRVLFDSKVPLWLFNSVVIALVSTLLVVMLSAMAAYALSKIRFRGSGLVYLFFLIGLMVPGEATIIPVSYTHLDVYKRQGYHHAGLLQAAYVHSGGGYRNVERGGDLLNRHGGIVQQV